MRWAKTGCIAALALGGGGLVGLQGFGRRSLAVSLVPPFPTVPDPQILNAYCLDVHATMALLRRPADEPSRPVWLTRQRRLAELDVRLARDIRAERDWSPHVGRLVKQGFMVVSSAWSTGGTVWAQLTNFRRPQESPLGGVFANVMGPQMWQMFAAYTESFIASWNSVGVSTDAAWRRLLGQACQDPSASEMLCAAPLHQQQAAAQICALIAIKIKESQTASSRGNGGLGDYMFSLQPSAADSGPRNFAVVAERILRLQQGLVLALPGESSDISHQYRAGNATSKAALDAYQHRLVHSYPSSMHASLDGLITSMRLNSFSPLPEPVTAYLYGPPGTGKTRFVELLASTFNLPLYSVRIDEAGDLRTLLLGERRIDLKQWIEQEKSDREMMGEIAHALVDSGISNPLLFVDEFGDGLSSLAPSDATATAAQQQMVTLFKLLLGASKHVVPLFGQHGMNVDYGRVTLLMAGNHPITDQALRSRLQVVTFDALPATIKRDVAQVYLDQLVASIDALPESVVHHVSQLLRDHLEGALALDLLHNNAGVRILQKVLRSFQSFLVARVLQNDVPPTQELRKTLADLFSSYSPVALVPAAGVAAAAADVNGV